ncbi:MULTISPECIES: cytochrome b [Rhizobium]|uniref:cytochrome b n=1 Tax=Rhizobium TaxID=379 RepID=UPI001C916AA6|nr:MULTISPECIES: cytochrome b/b6 domain-containing protein [Rhizobium]MBY3136698.1 cytochrome b [Rhizobium laguerreae]MBY5775418.1 cytochrome b [Rhizobium leguminosarum]
MTVHPERYTRTAIWLHWITAILMLIMLFQQMVGDNWIRVPVGGSMAGWKPSAHASIGILVLLLGLARLFWRIANPPPDLPAAMPNWQVWASHVVHWMFYVLMIGLPVTGMLALVPYGGGRLDAEQVRFLGLIPVGFMPDLGAWTGAAHELLTNIAKLLVIIHVLAALKHQFWERDRLLTRMDPTGKDATKASRPKQSRPKTRQGSH